MSLEVNKKPDLWKDLLNPKGKKNVYLFYNFLQIVQKCRKFTNTQKHTHMHTHTREDV